MESEDDMHDANDVESSDDDFYSKMDSESDYEFMTNEIDDSDEVTDSRGQKSFTILKEDDIRQRQGDDTMRISTVLSVSKEVASLLLRRYHCNLEGVLQEAESRRESVDIEADHAHQVAESASLPRNAKSDFYLDPLHQMSGPMARLRTKRMKEALNNLILEEIAKGVVSVQGDSSNIVSVLSVEGLGHFPTK